MADPSSRDDMMSLAELSRRVIVTLLLVALAVAVWRLSDLFILLFGAILMSIGLRAVANRLERATGIGHGPSLGLVAVLFITALGLAFWFFGSVAAGQMDELAQQVPAGLGVLIERLQSHPIGRYAIDRARDAGTAGATGWVASMLAVVTRSLARGAGYAILTFVVAIYLAAQPERYCLMILRLFPRPYRAQADHIFRDTAAILQRWLLGQLVVMLTIGVLSGIGLWALGIEAAFALGLVGGLLTFIPFVGAILAAIPAILVALTQGPLYALWVLLMYCGVHFVEGNFITPLVQAEATALPPVMSLVSIVAFSTIFGPSAVMLAVPLGLTLAVVVRRLSAEPVVETSGPRSADANPVEPTRERREPLFRRTKP